MNEQNTLQTPSLGEGRGGLRVKVLNVEGIMIPEYKTSGSAGCDLRANITEPVALIPGERFLVPTGLCIELPEGYEAQVRPRSGLALKHGITVLNTPGTIDSDYRGEVHACIINLGRSLYTIQPNERIAQMVIARYEQATFSLVDKLSDTVRGTNGHGSTGKA